MLSWRNCNTAQRPLDTGLNENSRETSASGNDPLCFIYDAPQSVSILQNRHFPLFARPSRMDEFQKKLPMKEFRTRLIEMTRSMNRFDESTSLYRCFTIFLGLVRSVTTRAYAWTRNTIRKKLSRNFGR